MKYRFAVERKTYTDFASGRVLYSAWNYRVSVRLASEIIHAPSPSSEQRCGPHIQHDPCRGGGFLLATNGFLFPERVAELIASDVDGQALEIAQESVPLTPEAIGRPPQELEGFALARQRVTPSEHLEPGAPAGPLGSADPRRDLRIFHDFKFSRAGCGHHHYRHPQRRKVSWRV